MELKSYTCYFCGDISPNFNCLCFKAIENRQHKSSYKINLNSIIQRNKKIIDQKLKGVSYYEIANKYNLRVSSIKRIK